MRIHRPIIATLLATMCCLGATTASPQAQAQATLSATSLSFPATATGATSSAQVITLTNPSKTTLSKIALTLSGTEATDFSFATTCGKTLKAATSCTISVTFKPAAAQSFHASLTLKDSAATAQTIELTGTGTGAGTTAAPVTLYTFPETDLTVTPLYALVNQAQRSIDMTMYELVDTTFSADLVAACQRGVKVRVILDQNLEKTSNTPAFNQLNAVTNCSAAWANKAFQATHQKSLILDGTKLAILSLNLTSRFYSTSRDFGFIESDAADIAAVQATFNADFNSTISFSFQPPAGSDLIWSPTTATADLLGIINGATKTLLVENEEMGAANIVSALEAACKRGVAVQIAMVDQTTYEANFSALEAAGCGVHTYPDTTTGFYIHAKAMVADYRLATQKVYLGSINFSIPSMTENRELGLFVTDQPTVDSINTTMTSDYTGAAAFTASH